MRNDEQKPHISKVEDRVVFCNLITKEIQKAEKKFPSWPIDIIHGVAIMQEEAGEAIQRAVQVVYEDGPLGQLKKELLHTGAMAMRMWISLL